MLFDIINLFYKIQQFACILRKFLVRPFLKAKNLHLMSFVIRLDEEKDIFFLPSLSNASYLIIAIFVFVFLNIISSSEV